MTKGIIVAEESVKGKLLLDSRKPRLQIAIGRAPAHINLQIVQGTAISTNAGNGFYAKEILFTMNHNLGYMPKALVYFYGISAGSYNIGKHFYGFGAADDYLDSEVSDTTFSIVHIFDDTAFGVGLTSTAPTTGNIRVKYSIFSNPVDNYTDPALR